MSEGFARDPGSQLVRRILASRATRVALTLALLVLVPVLPGALWFPRLADDLVCRESIPPSDAILVDNIDPTYHAFERAAALRNSGLGSKVFVPAGAGRDPDEPEEVSLGILEVMARVARLRDFAVIPVRLVEPISLNAAYQIRAALLKEHIRSVIVVSPGFRSHRSALVYGKVFGEAGIRTTCAPVFGPNTPDNWTQTWHGMQDVVEQFAKLQYYRWYVFPRYQPGRDVTPSAVRP